MINCQVEMSVIDKRWEQVSQIFEAVFFDTPVAERESRLAELCSGDPDLRARVERLLASAESTGPLDHSVSATMLPPASLNQNNIFVPGAIVGGRFRLSRLLGQGGMGQVWEAVDEHLHVLRAVKTLRPETAHDPGVDNRFRREVERSQAVTHPNVCRVYDLCYEGAVPFLSMELIEGESLGQRLRRKEMFPRRVAMPLLRQCAAALDAAHTAG